MDNDLFAILCLPWLPCFVSICSQLWKPGTLDFLALTEIPQWPVRYLGLSENSVPLNPMVLLIIIPIKWLFHWEYTQHFQTNPSTCTACAGLCTEWTDKTCCPSTQLQMVECRSGLAGCGYGCSYPVDWPPVSACPQCQSMRFDGSFKLLYIS